MSRSIKNVGTRILRASGLERAGRARELREATERAEKRVAQLKQLLDQARSEAKTWKAKAQDSAAHTSTHRQAEQQRYEAKAAKLEERVRRDLARIEQRDAVRAAKLAELREKVVATDRAVRIGRDHLMALEVKLDVIEGAINVLDRRFRALGPPAETAQRRGL